MQVTVAPDYAALSALGAGIVAGLIWAKPDAVLGLPTGSTPEGLYRVLGGLGVDFAHVRTFNLDEYVGIPPEHPQSYHTFMKKRLYDQVNIPPDNQSIPNGMASDLDAECLRYDEAIRAAGGIDLIVLGLGANGHIGFNEPSTPWNSRTRRVELAEETRRANARFFGSRELVPREALTMGIGTMLEARHIILLVSGAAKAAVVKRFLAGPLTPDLPATALRQHPQVTVILDRGAAGQIASPKPGPVEPAAP